MAKLLRKVRSTKDRGLVGITLDGEEVFLSDPKPNLMIIEISIEHLSQEQSKDYQEWMAKVVREYLIPKVSKDNYLQIGQEKIKTESQKVLIGISYNEFEKR